MIEARRRDSHVGLADGTPTCGSNARTHARTNEESSSLPEITSPSVTRARAYRCADCDNDATTAPGRYCAPRRCYCGHDTCPAAWSFVTREQRLRLLRDGGRR